MESVEKMRYWNGEYDKCLTQQDKATTELLKPHRLNWNRKYTTVHEEVKDCWLQSQSNPNHPMEEKSQKQVIKFQNLSKKEKDTSSNS